MMSHANINELPAPYDLKKMVKDCIAEGYATKYGIAWIEGSKIHHKEQKLGKSVSGIPSSSFIRCIRINKGAGWIIAERPNVASRLYDYNGVPAIQPAPVVARLVLTGWLKERHHELESWIKNACENDIFLAETLREKGKEIKSRSDIRKLVDESKTHSHLLLSLRLAFHSLDELELMMDYGERKDAKIKSNDGDAFFISAMKSGYEAGRRLYELRAELAIMKAMKMASQTSAGKKQSQRTEWLAAEINELEKGLGRKARTLQIIKHIENKTDPETKEAIWFQAREGDEEKVIQWGTNEVMTVKAFADKIARIRKSRK